MAALSLWEKQQLQFVSTQLPLFTRSCEQTSLSDACSGAAVLLYVLLPRTHYISGSC